ncbi:MAG: hypothetical protein ACOYOB_04900 [Myxococcota bacterium]
MTPFPTLRPQGRPIVWLATVTACALLNACSDTSSGDDTTTPTDTVVTDSADATLDTLPDTTEDVSGDTTVPEDTADTVSGPVLTPRSLKFDQDLFAVWGSSPQDAWLVGAKGLILHGNGQTFVPRASGTSATLRGVWGTGVDHAWFVGEGVLLEWNGLAIQNVTPDAAKGVVLRAVHASADGNTVVAAGDAGLILRRQPDGKWTKEETNSNADLYAIRVTSPGQIWAVGAEGKAVRFSGGTWSETLMPDAAGHVLRALDVSPAGRVFAAGDDAYLATFDGTWKSVLVNDQRKLYGIWALSNSDAWAIGEQGALVHLSLSGKWEVQAIDGVNMATLSFAGLWGVGTGSSAHALAVGQKGAGVVFIDGKWLDHRAETVADLRNVTAMADGSLVACGQYGSLLRAVDAQSSFFDLAAPATGVDLNDVAGDGIELWAVGTGGTVLHRDGKGVFQSEALPGAGELRGIAMLSGEPIAVGDDGFAAVRGTDGKWKTEATGTQVPLRSVAVAGTVAFAVGGLENTPGVVLRRGADGVWTPEDAAGALALRRVVAWGTGGAAAVGDGGAVIVRIDNAWTLVSESPGDFLHGVTRLANGKVLAAGWAGKLVIGQPGSSFQWVSSGVPTVLYGVVATDKGVVAVGMKGGVFQVAEKLP